MDIPTSNIVIFENNETRADLYGLWLDEYDVHIALTKQQAEEHVDTDIAVAILDEGFADGAASTVLDIINTQVPFCRVLATSERSTSSPDLDVEHEMVKPVFETDLVETVGNLVRRTNYQLTLQLYYQTNTELTSLELSEQKTDDPDRFDTLKQRASRLHQLLATLRQQLSDDDIRAVMRSVTIDEPPVSAPESHEPDSKYRPEKCFHCQRTWNQSTDGEAFVRLGAHVWRCKQCGAIQMHSDPSHQRIGSYRR